MHPADYLFPRELETTPTGLSRILVIGSCLTEQYLDNFRNQRPDIAFDYVPFNNLMALPDLTTEDAASYQLQYIQIPLRTLVGDNLIRAVDFAQAGGYQALAEQAAAMLQVVLDAALRYQREHGLLTLVSNFIVPQGPTAPALDARGTESDLARLVRFLNQALDDLVRDKPNTWVADVDSAANTFGKRFFLDDPVSFSTHVATLTVDVETMDNAPTWAAPASGRIEPLPDVGSTYGLQTSLFSELVLRQIEWLYRIVRQLDTVKIVFFDLDNTLWRGQIAEHYEHGREWPVLHFWPAGIWDAIQQLRRRGIIVSITSKNDEHIVRERWERAVLPWLRYDDFVLPKINWQPKSQNIRDTLATLSLTAKSAVFVDDNPVERDEVRSNIPGIRVIGSDPFVTRRILLWSAETQRVQLGAEAAQREASYRNIVARESEKASISRADFLAGLDVRMQFETIADNAHPGYARASELINKTNQFNTTGVRWSAADFAAFFGNGGVIHSFSVQDKFSDYGQVGAVLVQHGVIRQYTMSCRVLGMDVELAALHHVADVVFAAGAELLVGAVVETELNTPCRDVYDRAGFEPVPGRPGLYVLRPSMARTAVTHVRID